MTTRVKVCGITRMEDGLAAARAGADAIGFVFYPPSPRYVTPEHAYDIAAMIPPFVSTVGLFVDADAVTVAAADTGTGTGTITTISKASALPAAEGLDAVPINRKAPLDVVADVAGPLRLSLLDPQTSRGSSGVNQGCDDTTLRRPTAGAGIAGPALAPVNFGEGSIGSQITATERSANAVMSARVASALTNATFTNELNRVRDTATEEEALEQTMAVSSAAAGAGLSVLYLAWLLRGSVLLTTMLTSLPAWRFVDPLPVMGKLDDEEDEDGESIESIVADSGGNTA